MEKVSNLPNVHFKNTLGGDIYYKITFNDSTHSHNIASFFNKLRNTGHMDEVKRKLNSTSFLEGVAGNVLIFKVTTDFMGRESTPDERGVWIHQSLLYPYIIMSSTGGLHYMVTKFDSMIRDMTKVQKDNKELAMTIAKQQRQISELEASLEAYRDCDEEVEVDDYGFIKESPKEQLALPLAVEQRHKEETKKNTLWLYAGKGQFTMSFIDKGIKKCNIQWGNQGKLLAKAMKFSDMLIAILVDRGYLHKKDTHHYMIDNSYRQYMYSYRPTRNGKMKEENEKGMPVQLIGLTPIGVETFIELMWKLDIIEPTKVEYLESKA